MPGGLAGYSVRHYVCGRYLYCAVALADITKDAPCPTMGQRSQSARGFCPRSTMRVPQPDIIEHFGNADAVPQPPKRCLSR